MAHTLELAEPVGQTTDIVAGHAAKPAVFSALTSASTTTSKDSSRRTSSLPNGPYRMNMGHLSIFPIFLLILGTMVYIPVFSATSPRMK